MDTRPALCLGAPAVCHERLVLRACDELESRIYKEAERVRTHLLNVFPHENPAEVCQEWLSAIITMRACAEQRDVCSWTMHPLPGEVAYFLGVTMRLTKSMVATQNANRSANQQIPTPAVVDVIESKSEEEQIAFINSVVDGLSDPKADLCALPKGAPPLG